MKDESPRMKYLLHEIYRKSKFNVNFSGLQPARLKFLRDHPSPESTDSLVYFSSLMPSKDIKIGENLLLFCPERFCYEIDELLPFCEIAPHGFYPIGCDESGDSIAFFVETGSIYQISHDLYEDGSILGGWNSDHSGFLPDLEINSVNIAKTATKIFQTFCDFLESNR